ncbi:hypothetical protein D1007_20278 [Hordeum vulgare]|nr:hypothetical protein D1007_20278 [Hordeum vulgare]
MDLDSRLRLHSLALPAVDPSWFALPRAGPLHHGLPRSGHYFTLADSASPCLLCHAPAWQHLYQSAPTARSLLVSSAAPHPPLPPWPRPSIHAPGSSTSRKVVDIPVEALEHYGIIDVFAYPDGAAMEIK